MEITENDRLDLRQALAESLGSEHLANVAMEAMPPLDYDQLATKTDLDILGRELRAEMAELRGELRGDLASNLRLMLAAQVTTMMMLGAWVTAVT
ncbi:MAG: hypothetical protein AAGA93_03045 [Actinomycetota bacterium]